MRKMWRRNNDKVAANFEKNHLKGCVSLGRPKSDITVCIIKECSNKVKARGMCHKHYKEFFSKSVCGESNCKEKVHAKGLCYRHYHKEYQEVLRNTDKPVCYEVSCNEQSISRGLCRKHYQLARNGGYLPLFPKIKSE